MPPRKNKQEQEPKARVKAKAKPSPVAIAPLLDAENDAALASTGAKYNLDLMTSTVEALEELTKNTWPGIANEEPLPLGKGANQAVFDVNQLKAALFPGGVADPSSSYVCSQSIFKCDLLFNADPSVPLRQKSINELGARYYENPARFHTRVRVAIAPDWHLSCDPKKVKPVSPVENVMGFVLSMFRDNQDEEKLAQWKRHALSVEFEYSIATSDADLYFLAANIRQDLMSDRETMAHTCLQKMFSVLSCKARFEKIHGALSSEAFSKMYMEHFRASSETEKVTESFVETAVSLHKRVFSNAKLLDLLLEADECSSDTNPFNSYTKLQVIVHKSKSPRNVEWSFGAMYDGWKNGHLGTDMLTWRGINNSLHGKGTCDLFVGQLELREHLFSQYVPKWGWTAELISEMREVCKDHVTYRRKCGYSHEKKDLTWRAGWPKSAELFWALLEDCLFSNTFEATFKNLVRHRKSVSEWCTHSEVENRIGCIQEQAQKEIKEAKKKSGEEDPVDDEDDVQMIEDPVEEDEKGTGHLKVPESLLKTKKKGTKNQSTECEPLDLDEESLRRLDAFKQKACNMVRTHVKLIVEEDSLQAMTAALETTSFTKWKGEIDPETNQIFKSVVIYFDSKLAGEAGTQPSLRVPPLRDGRHPKLFMSALSLRCDNGKMRPGDCMLIMDGGRDGLTSSLLGAVKPSATTTLTKWKGLKFLMWDETSIRKNKNRNKGSVVGQLERLHIILGEEAGLVYKKRRHYGGTSHGDCIGPVLAPDWDDEKETWRATYGEKKALYGLANRPPVGGQPDAPPAEHQKGVRRRDAETEPVAYHSLPSEAVAEIFQEFNISAMLDLSCCDGKPAWEAILQRVAYVGVCFTDDHVKLLYKRLELKCWEGMLDPESPIFEPTLLALVQKKKSKNQKAKGKKTDEDENGGEDDEEQGEDEGDEGQEDQEDEDEEQDDEEDEDQEEPEDDDAMEDDEEEDQDDDTEDPKPRRKTKGAAGKAKAKAKAAGKAKAKAKGKAKGKGRPKAGSKKAGHVLDKLKKLM